MEKTPLAGTVVNILTVPVYEAKDFAAAVQLGNFINDTNGIVYQFKNERVGLAAPAHVELAEFERDWRMDEAIAWGETHGNKEPIDPAHLLGIVIGLSDAQNSRPIVELGSVGGGGVLYLFGSFAWRCLRLGTVESNWDRRCLVGFVSEFA